MSSRLARQWLSAVRDAPGSSSLVSAQHPLRIFYGSDATGRARLVVLVAEEPPLPRVGDQVLIERGRRPSDGVWTLVLTLLDARLQGIFMKLAGDLIGRTEAAGSEQEGMRLLLRALDDWRRLLKLRTPTELSIEKLRGLCGEIWVALNHLAPVGQLASTLDAWEGPLGHPQDFAVPGQPLCEVKSVGSTATGVKISSAEQLDPLERRLELVVLRLPSVAGTDPAGFSLVTLVQEVRDRLEGEGADDFEFDFKLRLMGVDLTSDYYAQQWFTAESITVFEVQPTFPAVRASEISPAVSKVRYEVALSALTEFTTSHKRL